MKFVTSIKMILPAVFMMAGLAQAEPARDLSDFNLENGVGIHGYDPVAPFTEGGGQPQKGQEQIQIQYLGVTYYFANSQNASTFMSNPAKYESSYGGFCAYAMASGCKVEIDPSIFTIKGERIHYFVSNRAKRNFDANADQLESQADANYEKMHGLNLKITECLP